MTEPPFTHDDVRFLARLGEWLLMVAANHEQVAKLDALACRLNAALPEAERYVPPMFPTNAGMLPAPLLCDATRHVYEGLSAVCCCGTGPVHFPFPP